MADCRSPYCDPGGQCPSRDEARVRAIGSHSHLRLQQGAENSRQWLLHQIREVYGHASSNVMCAVHMCRRMRQSIHCSDSVAVVFWLPHMTLVLKYKSLNINAIHDFCSHRKKSVFRGDE
ncbi:hypothetical protein EVAR_91688_1 [Eumeta japonica]|uniref:Uncharacterized protein n=1 Tax=Eumeta variegata TaxID=151549 RepID=A0A4C1ZGP8_EUMVA|nr:hypothetical protein EVAR_91688_1 [Eumeta japonica]